MIKTKEDYQNTINKLRSIVRSWGKADVYLVGGCVRDDLLGRLPKDIDLVIDYPNGSEEFIEYLKQNYTSDVCNGYTVFPKYGTARFSLRVELNKWVPIECVIPRTEKYEGTTRKPSSVKFGSLLEDSMRRDFCCNALYKNVLNSDVLDPTGHGLEDLQSMILRTPLDPEQTFLDDPLRMLRAIRFSCCKGFKIDQEVYNKIKPYPGFYTLSWERIQDEFTKIMLSPTPIEGIRMLQDRGLLKHILPEFSMLWGMDQKSKYHSLDLTEHTFKVLSGVLGKGCDHYELELRLAALLHDVGKGFSKVTKLDDTCSYYGHEKTSAEIAEKNLRNLKYSNEVVELVKKLIENHMCIKSMYDYKTDKYTGSPKFTRKISKKLHGILSIEMALINADNLAHAPEYCMPGQVRSFWEHYKSDVILAKKNDDDVLKSPIDGNEIMKLFGVSGKAVGDIKHLFEIWLFEDLRLGKDELVSKYIDFTDGIEVWVSREKSTGSYVVSYCEPTIDDFCNKVPYGSTMVRYSKEGTFKENINLEKGEKIKVEAKSHPALHLALLNQKEAERILHEVGEKLGELSLLDGFLEIDLLYDHQNDLSYGIKWEDGRNEYYA